MYADQETGLYYNWFRFYDPKTGRYPQSDPIGLAGGLNTYTYVLNNPLKYIDPFGLDVIAVFYPGGVTHIGIGINTPNTVGFYPKIRETRVAFCRSAPGAVLSDSIFQSEVIERAQSIRIKTTPAQDKRMQFVINRLQEGGVPTPPYNLCNNQCTAFVRQVLQAGGIYVPNDIVLPSSLFEYLNKTYGNQNEH